MNNNHKSACCRFC